MSYPEGNAHFLTSLQSTHGLPSPIPLHDAFDQASLARQNLRYPQVTDWERNKAVIIHYYMAKGMTLTSVRQVMENCHGFKAS
jgi:hypothetical protein